MAQTIGILIARGIVRAMFFWGLTFGALSLLRWQMFRAAAGRSFVYALRSPNSNALVKLSAEARRSQAWVVVLAGALSTSALMNATVWLEPPPKAVTARDVVPTFLCFFVAITIALAWWYWRLQREIISPHFSQRSRKKAEHGRQAPVVWLETKLPAPIPRALFVANRRIEAWWSPLAGVVSGIAVFGALFFGLAPEVQTDPKNPDRIVALGHSLPAGAGVSLFVVGALVCWFGVAAHRRVFVVQWARTLLVRCVRVTSPQQQHAWLGRFRVVDHLGLQRRDLRIAAYALEAAARRADRQGDTTHPIGVVLREVASAIRGYSTSLVSLHQPLPGELRDRLLLTIAVLDNHCPVRVTKRLAELGSGFGEDGQPGPEFRGRPRSGLRSALSGLHNSLDVTRQTATTIIVLIGVVALLAWLVVRPHNLAEIVDRFRP